MWRNKKKNWRKPGRNCSVTELPVRRKQHEQNREYRVIYFYFCFFLIFYLSIPSSSSLKKIQYKKNSYFIITAD